MTRQRKLEIAFGSLCFVAALSWSLWMALETFQRVTMAPIEASAYSLDTPDAMASAVAITPQILLTAGHVAVRGLDESGEKKPGFSFDVVNEYMPKPLQATTLWANQSYDIGLLSVDGVLPYHVKDIACGSQKLGEIITLVGFPSLGGSLKAQGPVLTKGVVASKLQRNNAGMAEWFLSDARSSFGGSGGPAFDSQRRLAGIFVSMFGDRVPIGEGEDEELKFIPYGFSGVVTGSAICKFLGRAS